MKSFITLLLFVLCFSNQKANAQTAAIQSTNTPAEISTQDFFGNEGINVGWSFTVGAAPITVTTLGVYDAGGDGLAEAHQVGIWTSDGTLLASTTIPAETAATLSSGYRYSSITPLNLVAGQGYVIGTLYVFNSNDRIILNSSQTIAPQISFNNSLQTKLTFTPINPPFGMPNFGVGAHNQGIFGPNFQFVPPPDLSINDVTQNEGNSSQAIFTFKVSLSAPAGLSGVSFNLTTSDGTTNPATQPSDYTAISGPYYIPEGSSELTVNVLVNGDNDVESDETFLVKISNVTDAVVVDGEGLATILNDDAYDPCADITPISCATPATFSLSGDGIWNTATPCIDNTYGKEKIYSFTATTTGRHQVQISARSGGSIAYSYKAASGGCSPTGWTCINADSGYPFGPLTAGVTYYILVDANQTTAASQTFQINCPVDPCLSIPTISCETPVTSNQTGPGAWIVTACGANTPGQEKVYSFTAAVTGIYNLEITPTSGPYSIEYFYKAASDGCDATDWNCIGSTYIATSFSIGTLTGGTTYYIMLKSHGAVSTSHTFQINCPAPTSVGDRVWNDTDGDGVQDGGEAGINGVTVNLKDGGGSVIATTTTAGDGNYLFSNLAAGAYSVVVISPTLPSGYSPTYDLDGTATPHTATFTLATGQTRTDVDFGYRQPAVTCPADITVNSLPILCGALVTYPPVTSPPGSCGGAITYSKPSGSYFQVGTTTVTATTSCGTSCSFKITVIDVQKPVIVCPSDITVTATSNSCSKAVTFNLTVADNCPGATVTTSPASGSLFNVGTTTVTATAIDASGNKTTSTFKVKVKESQPPVIKVVATPIVLLWPANGSYQKINVSQFVVSVTDNCSSIPVSNVKITKVTSDEPDNASGDADGNTTKDMKIAGDCKSVDLRRERNSKGNGRVYTIYVSVTDASGNTGTASFKVIAPISQNGTTATDNGSACSVSSYCSGNSYRPGATITEEEVIVKNEIPEGFMLDQNYPNPFSSVTTVRYAIPVEAKVSLGVYNQLGQRVAQLAEGKMSAGYHQAKFDATKLAGGIYFYRFVAADADGKPVVLTKKMIVAK